MKTYKRFVSNADAEDTLGFIEEDVDTLIQQLDVADVIDDNLQLESLSGVVSAVAGGIAIKIKSLPSIEKGILMASIVVPAISDTTNLSSLMKLLINVDFPALGLPKTAIFFPATPSSSISSGSCSSRDFLSVSNPLECSALMCIKSITPFEVISFIASDLDDLSDLLSKVINGLFNFLRLLRISKSSAN